MSRSWNKAVHTEIRVNKHDLIGAAQFAALPLSKQVDAVWFRCSEKDIRVHTPGRADNSGSSTIAATITNPIDFAASASGLISAVRSLDTEEVTIQMEESPVLMTASHNGTRVGVCRMRLET